jgi:hypothetical protein
MAAAAGKVGDEPYTAGVMLKPAVGEALDSGALRGWRHMCSLSS